MNGAKVLVVSNIKGGTGKTTVAIQLAAFLSDYGRVLLVDSDPQKSLVKWNGASDGQLPVPVFSNSETNVHREIHKLLPDYDFVIVDTPPSALALSEVTRSALLVANFAIVPITPSILDVWEAIGILDLIQELNETRLINSVQPMIHRILINKVKPRTNLAADVNDLLNAENLSTFTGTIGEREIYKKAAAAGLTVFQMPPSHATKTATNEISKIGMELLETLNEQTELTTEIV